jgi:hypothetical protein
MYMYSSIFLYFRQVWRTEGVIASLAFHPIDQLLVIAAFDDLLFWDWSHPEPFAKVKTRHEEKVRYVKFDTLGHTLVTGIANLGPGHHHQNPHIGLNVAAEPNRIYPRSYAQVAGNESPGTLAEERRHRIFSRCVKEENSESCL